MASLRKFAALIASLLIAATGAGIFLVAPIFGTMMALCGLGLVIWQGIVLWRSREDPYDLKKLWDSPVPIDEDVPDESPVEEDAMAFCHVCGHAVPLNYARCPECGNPL
ncbi:MAG: hypothetical protein QM758_28165 [Armatimonas sp.]